MNDLKTLNDQLAEVRRQQSDLASRLGELGAERHSLETAATDRATSIAAAEQDLIEQLARKELNEPHDVDGAQQRLNAARLQAQNQIEGITRLRVLDALRARHEAEHAKLHTDGVALIERIKHAEIEALRTQANEIRNDAEVSMETLARSESLLNAIRTELNERGAPYDLPVLNQAAVEYRSRLTPVAARTVVLAEINA